MSGFQSSLYVPVKIEDGWVVMGVHRPRPHSWTASEEALANVIAALATLAFRNILERDRALAVEREVNLQLTRAHGLTARANAGLERLQEAHAALLGAQIDSAGPQHLCEVMSGLLGAQVVWLDRFDQVLGSAGGEVDLEQVAELAELVGGLGERLHGADQPQMVEHGGRHLLVGQALDGRHRVGRLVAPWPGPEHDDLDLRVLALGCLHVALEVLRQRAAAEAEVRLQQDFAAVLSAPGATGREVTQRASMLGIDLGDRRRVLRVRVAGTDDLSPRDAAEVARNVQGRVGAGADGVVVVPIGRRDFVVVASGSTLPGAVSVSDAVRRAVRDSIAALQGVRAQRVSVSVGLGSVGVGPVALRSSHDEALRSLEVLEARGETGGDLTIADAGSYALLAATTVPDREGFVERYLGALVTYDHTQTSNLVETLLTYLDAGCNLRQTADTLYLHLSTVRYRLRRIEQIADVSLRDSEHRLCLHMALRLAGMTGPSAARTDETRS